MLTLKEAFLRMSSDKDDEMPKLVKDFLRRHYDMSQFKSRKRRYLLLKLKGENEFLDHLALSYSLINFWVYLFRAMFDESQVNQSRLESAVNSFREKMRVKSGECLTVCALFPSPPHLRAPY